MAPVVATRQGTKGSDDMYGKGGNEEDGNLRMS